MLSKPIRTQLARFCAGEVDPQTFESWVCEDVGIEGELGHGVYLDLAAADYRGRDVGGVRELCERILDEHHPGMLKRYRVMRVLESMIRGGPALLPGLRQLVGLYHQGYEFIPIEFVGCESETDSIPGPKTSSVGSGGSCAGTGGLASLSRGNQEGCNRVSRRSGGGILTTSNRALQRTGCARR
jgi:hypothetical protein